MRRYRVHAAPETARDLNFIEQHLIRAYGGFGESLEEAESRAVARIGEALAYMRSLESHPHRGTGMPGIRPELRHVAHARFVVYVEVDDDALEVRVLAVFFGGADHRAQILERLRP